MNKYLIIKSKLWDIKKLPPRFQEGGSSFLWMALDGCYSVKLYIVKGN